MPKPRKGTVEYQPKKGDVPGHFRVRVTLNSGDRSPWIDLNPTSDSPNFREWAESEAKRYSKRAKDENLTLADFNIVREGKEAPSNETCADYFTRWTKARKAAGLTSVRNDQGRWSKWIAPHLETTPIASVTTRQLEQVVQSLDSDVRADKLAWKTAVHAWSLVSKMFDDAHRSKELSLRARADNPAKSVRGPDRGDSRVGPYLFPRELEKLLLHERVPFPRRRLYVFAIFTGMRAGEIRALAWNDVHEDEGYIQVHQATDHDSGETKSTKTGRGRKVPIEPALAPLLEAMREQSGGDGNVFAKLPHKSELAWLLREDLKEAKVTRDELHTDTKTTRKLDFHDLRHTYGTWRAIRGDELTKISRAMGHSTTAMTEKYVNEAEAFNRERFGVPFAPLPSDIVSESSAPAGFAQKHRENGASPGGIGTLANGPRRTTPADIWPVVQMRLLA